MIAKMDGGDLRSPRVLIVGAGHAGVQAATALAEARQGLEVILLEQERQLPYERPPLSKEQLDSGDDPVDLKLLRRAEFYAEQGIELVQGAQVTAIERDEKVVVLASGERLGYDYLILATGSTPVTPPVPGMELDGVRLLKTAQDSAWLRPDLAPGRRIFIVGAGYIGLEVATAAARAGCEVTVVEQQDRVMARVTSVPVSRFYEHLHRSAQVRLMLGSTLQALEGTERVERVLTGDGRIFEVDTVVVGVGVRPNQSLPEAAGLKCADGVIVDEFARTTDPAIYAIGDVSRSVSTEDAQGVRLESVQNAVAQARAAATHLLSGEKTQPEIPWFWTVQHGVRLQTAGLRREDDEVVLRGDPDSGKFSVLYLREDRLAAIDTVGSLRDFMPGRKLIASGARIDRSRAVDTGLKLGLAKADEKPDEEEEQTA